VRAICENMARLDSQTYFGGSWAISLRSAGPTGEKDWRGFASAPNVFRAFQSRRGAERDSQRLLEASRHFASHSTRQFRYQQQSLERVLCAPDQSGVFAVFSRPVAPSSKTAPSADVRLNHRSGISKRPRSVYALSPAQRLGRSSGRKP